jgi:hypothetical protein
MTFSLVHWRTSEYSALVKNESGLAITSAFSGQDGQLILSSDCYISMSRRETEPIEPAPLVL